MSKFKVTYKDGNEDTFETNDSSVLVIYLDHSSKRLATIPVIGIKKIEEV